MTPAKRIFGLLIGAAAVLSLATRRRLVRSSRLLPEKRLAGAPRAALAGRVARPQPKREIPAPAKGPLTRKLSRSKGRSGTANLNVSPSGRSSRGFAASVPRRVSHAYRSPKPLETRTSAQRQMIRRNLKKSGLSRTARKRLTRQFKLG